MGSSAHFQMSGRSASWGARATSGSAIGKGPAPLGLSRWVWMWHPALFSICSGSGLRWANRPGGKQISLAGKGNKHDMCWVGRAL